MRNAVRRYVAGIFLLISVIGLTSCSQSQIYATDKQSGVYAAIPNGWQKITTAQLTKAESQSTADGVR